MRVFLKEVSGIWVLERPAVLAAALAYYAIFALVPIIFVAFTLAGLFINALAAADRLTARLETLLGPQVVAGLQEILARTQKPASGESLLASIVSFLALLFAAAGLFYQLQYALNKIWGVPLPVMGRPAALVRQRLFSFLMVLAVGLLLIIATLANLLIAWLGQLLSRLLGIGDISLLLTLLASLALLTLCLTLLYKIVPDVKIAWRDVLPGAFLTALLIMLAGFVMGLYFRLTSASSALGAAGSTAVVLIGIYYLAQIFLFGAIFSRVYAGRYGSRRPSEPPDNGARPGEIKEPASGDGAPPT